jgi:hypothetical protein
LTEELVAIGHQVTLFASGDSVTSARLHAVWPRSRLLGIKMLVYEIVDRAVLSLKDAGVPSFLIE